MLGFMAEKIGMTQVFDEQGNAIPVTVFRVLENIITQIKTEESKDGYNAVQIGAGEVKRESRLSKGEIGHCKKNDLPAFRHLKEYRLSAKQIKELTIGQEINIAEILGEKDNLLDVTNRPKGRGTMGRIKRHNQHRRLMTHGTKHHRQIGSAGLGTTPGRVFPGKKMPGREANVVTMKHLKFFSYNPEHKLLLIAGSVPGHKNSIVSIQPSIPSKGWNEYALNVGKRKAVA